MTLLDQMRLLELSGVVVSAALPDTGFDRLRPIGGEVAKFAAAARDRSFPRVHTLVVAHDQDLSGLDLVIDRNSNLFRERSPTSDFVIVKAESLTKAIKLLRMRLEQLEAGSLSNNLPGRDPEFVGRRSLFRKLDEWIATTPAGYLLIVGGVGRGKTAFMAECVHSHIEQGEVPVYHFIDYHPSVTGGPESVANSLYQQLRIKYAVWEPREWGIQTAGDRLELILKDQVAPKLGGRKEVLFVDAADQVGVKDLEFLLPGALRLRLPAGVLCVITSRYQLAWLGQPVTTWHWDDVADERGDVGEFLERRSRGLPVPLDELFVKTVLDQPGPKVFFTVKKNLRTLEAEGQTAVARELRANPLLWLLPAEELIEGDAQTRIRRLTGLGITEQVFWRTLGLLACAGKHLSPELMQELRVWEEGTTDVILRMAANFFKTDMQVFRPQLTFEFDHPGYQRSIAGDPNDLTRTPGHLSEADRRWCHSRLADGCWHALVHGDFVPAMQYATEYLPRHLREAGRAEELVPFLGDFIHMQRVFLRLARKMPRETQVFLGPEMTPLYPGFGGVATEFFCRVLPMPSRISDNRECETGVGLQLTRTPRAGLIRSPPDRCSGQMQLVWGTRFGPRDSIAEGLVLPEC